MRLENHADRAYSTLINTNVVGGSLVVTIPAASAREPGRRIAIASVDASACTTDEHVFTRLLSTDGTESGTINAILDHSSAAQDYYVAPAAGKTLFIERLLFEIKDNGNLTADSYGSASALTNGVEILYVTNGNTISLTGNHFVHSNAEYARLMYDVAEHTFGSGDNFFSGRFTFGKFLHNDVKALELTGSDTFAVQLNDSFTALTGHYFVVQGTEMTTNHLRVVGGPDDIIYHDIEHDFGGDHKEFQIPVTGQEGEGMSVSIGSGLLGGNLIVAYNYVP